MHKNIIFFLFISFFTQTSELPLELPEDTLSHIFLCVDYTTKKKLKITCRVFYNIFKKNLYLLTVDFCQCLDINDYIDLLYLNVNNNSFIDHKLDYDKMNDFDYKTVCAIVPCGDGLGMNRTILKVGQKYLKFFFPYGRIIVALKTFIHGHYEKFLKNCIVKKIVKDICIFCDSEYCEKENLSQDYFIGILNNIKQKSLEEKETLLKKALVEKNFSNIVFLLYIINNCNMSKIRYYHCSENSFYNNHSIMGSNRLYNALNHEQRMLLARANCSMFIESRIVDGLYGKGQLHKHITLFMRAVENRDMDVALSLLEIMVEQGYDFSSRGHSIDQLVTVNGSVCKETIGLIPYLLNNNACSIVEILIKNKFKLFSYCMQGATSDQIKTIVNIYCKIFSDPWDQMKRYLFLHTAVEENDINLVQFLLDHGANINESCMSNINFQYPPIGYSLNNDKMIDFFIKNIHLLDKGKVEFFDWKKPYNTANIRKLIEKDYFCEGEVFSFICKAIQLNNSLLYELVFKNKKLVNEYKALDAWGKHALFRKAVDKKDKRIINLFRHNGFNMFEKLVVNYPSDHALNYQNEKCLRRSLSFINHKYIIQDYEKHKQNMTCEQYLCVLDICKDHGVLRDHLLKNDDIGKINLLPMILSEEIIEKRINQILDRPLFKKKSLFNWFAAKNIKNLLLRDQQHLRLIE